MSVKILNLSMMDNTPVVSNTTLDNGAYPESSVGAVMTRSFVTLSEDQTVSDALETIRLDAPVKDTIYFAYILDGESHIVGTVSLRDLILAKPEDNLGDIMKTHVVFCNAVDNQSEAVRLIGEHDLLALPVLDEEGHMVGIVMHDDAFDVAAEDSTEDQFKLGAVGGKISGSIKSASVAVLYRMRVGWLVLLVFGNIFSGAGIAYFEGLIESMVALVFFLPLLVDSGGNAGSQSATLVVRALAMGDVGPRDWVNMLGKEFTVSLLLGLTMALAVSSIGFFRAGTEVAVVVSMTMILIVMIGSVIGMLLPFILDKLNLDPASASAPLITTICDGVGVLIYFNVANTLLDVPGMVAA